MAEKGYVYKMKQIFECISLENISPTEMLGRNINVSEGKSQAFVDSFFCDGVSLLTIAAENGHTHVCEYLIKQQQANVDTRSTFKDHQNTALICATRCNRVGVVKLLVNCNANIMAKNDDGDHASYYAAFYGHLDCLKILVEKNEDVVNLKGSVGEQTPLMAACMHGEVDIVEYLLSKPNIDVNAKDENGDTALHYAAFEHQIAILDMLVHSGAKNLRNNDDIKPLDYSIFS